MHPRHLRCALLALLISTMPAIAQNERPQSSDQFQSEQPPARRTRTARRQPPPADAAKPKIRVYQLEHASVVEVTRALSSIKSALEPNCRFTPDERTNAIVVAAASDAAWNGIDALIKSLDVPQPQSMTKIVPLVNLDAKRLTSALIQSLQDSSNRVRIVPESGSNTLLLSGPAPEIEQVVQIVQQLESIKAENAQQQAAQALQIHVLPLRHADPEKLSPLIDRALSWQKLPIRITGDRASRQLLVYTNEAGWKQVQQLVQQFDVPSVETEQQQPVAVEDL